MEEKKEILLNNVKFAVQKYHMDGVTVRKISDVCRINDSHLHRFFKNKEELLIEAYKREATSILDSIKYYLDSAEELPLENEQRERIAFHWIWNSLLSDRASVDFCVDFYYSTCFSDVLCFHEQFAESLKNRCSAFLCCDEIPVSVINTMMCVIYANLPSKCGDSDDDIKNTEECVFQMLSSLLKSFLYQKAGKFIQK